ncbi:MAG: YebC/PmpR family DNA-binding transcriptional regulator [Halanaerobiaceae bacterium]
MAGHSKWANIKHKKKKEDKRRAKLFSKLSKKITVAAREGGGDPEYNADLNFAIQKAKDNNMPNENIEKAIKRGTGELEGVNYESFVYEGYGPGGVALYMDIMSDNRNRTASELRHILSEHGGNLGESGCVAWMFERRGQIILAREENTFDEEDLLLEALEAGAEDMEVEDKIVSIFTEVENLKSTRSNLEELGYQVDSADLVMIPESQVKLDDSGTAKKLLRLMEELEDHDDIQDVYSNFDIPDKIMEEIEDEV